MYYKVLYIVAPERFRDEELAIPRAALEQAGHAVTVASTRPGTAAGMLGARVAVQQSVGRQRPEDYDLLVIAGGAGSPSHLWDHEPLIRLARNMRAAGKPVAAICLSPPVLARAGVLAGRRATTFPTERAIVELKRGGATYVEEPVVTDGAIVTADGPEAAAAFGAALTQLLSP
jgi:protease I